MADNSYADSLGRAAEAIARSGKAEAKRRAQDNPIYKTGQLLELAAMPADIALSAFKLPPIAGSIAGGLKGIAGGASGVEGESVEKGVGSLAKGASAFMNWKQGRDRKKLEQDHMSAFLEALNGKPQQ